MRITSDRVCWQSLHEPTNFIPLSRTRGGAGVGRAKRPRHTFYCGSSLQPLRQNDHQPTRRNEITAAAVRHQNLSDPNSRFQGGPSDQKVLRQLSRVCFTSKCIARTLNISLLASRATLVCALCRRNFHNPIELQLVCLIQWQWNSVHHF